MRFKRMISAVASAAIAVTSLSVSMTTGIGAIDASSYTETKIGSFYSGSVVLSGTTWNSQWTQLSQNNMSGGYNWDSVFAADDVYLKAVYSMDATSAAAHNNGYKYGVGDWYTGDIKAGNYPFYYDGLADETAGGEYAAYVKFSDLGYTSDNVDEYGQIGFNMQCNLGSSDFELKELSLVRLENKVYYEKAIFEGTTTEKIFINGTDFNKDTLSEDAKIKIWYTTGNGTETEYGNSVTAGWGIGKLMAGTEATLWHDASQVMQISSEGNNVNSTAEPPFSSFTAGYDRFAVQLWESTSVITKVAILDTVQSVAVTGVSLDNAAAEFALGSDGFNTASKTLTAIVAPADATDTSVAWTSSNENVAKVVDGVVTPVGIGEALITATTNDGGYKDTCAVSVKPVAATKLTIGASTNAEGGDKIKLDVAVEPANAYDKTVKFSSSDEAVATVDADGNVTFAMVDAEKTVEITAATTYTNADFGIDTVSDTIEITVAPKDVSVPVTGVALDKTEVSVAKGEKATLTATVTPDNAEVKTVTWSSSDEKVATVVDGVVTAVAEGTATITVKTTDGGFTASCTVTVTAPKAESVTILINEEAPENDEFSMMNGRSRRISATVSPADAAQNVTFAAADTSVVTIENGLITAVGEGKTAITATADGASKTITVTVTAKSNVPYTTDEGIVIFDGKGTSSGWNQAVVMYEYGQNDGPFKIADLKAGMKFKVYYTSSSAPELIFQSWSGGASWAKVEAASSANGVATYTYDDIVKAYGSDFTALNAINVGGTGNDLTVTKVVMVYSDSDTPSGGDDKPSGGDDSGFSPVIPVVKPGTIVTDDTDDDTDDADDSDDTDVDDDADVADDDVIEDDDSDDIIIGAPVSITELSQNDEIEEAAKGMDGLITMFVLDTGTANPKGEFNACIGSQLAGEKIDLYKLNPETGKLEFVGAYEVDEDGYIVMEYDGSASYAVFRSGANDNAADASGESNPGTGVQTTAGIIGIVAAAASAALFVSAKKKEN